MLEIDESTLKAVSEQFYLPPKPEILSKLQEYCETEDVPIRELSDLVAQDIAISSAILKIINSPAYGLARTVSDIKQAVMFLGEKGVTTLVQSIKLKQAFSGQESALNLDQFWDYSANIANATMLVGRHVKAIVPIEDLYSVGLFHDCGIPPLAIKHSDYCSRAPIFDNPDAITTEQEDQLYSTNHAVVGYFIANTWNLPKDLCRLILEHHNPTFLSNDRSMSQLASYSALKLAEHLVNLIQYNKPSRDWPLVAESVTEFLGLVDDDIADLQEDITNLLLS